MMRGSILIGNAGHIMTLFGVMGLVGLILLIVAIILLFKNTKKNNKEIKAADSDSAVKTVKMLYAEGTIDEEEFNKRIAVLQGKAVFTTETKTSDK